jgi:hypothetical protein
MDQEAIFKRVYPDLATYYQKIREQQKDPKWELKDPLASLWIVYQGADNQGTDQSVEAVLNKTITDLSPMPAFTQSLEKTFAAELSKDQFYPKTCGIS